MDQHLSVIDIGSSAIKYGIYDFSDHRASLVTEGDPVATSLGRGMKHGDDLNPEARDETLQVIARFCTEIQDAGAELKLVCATEAVRRAKDQKAFLDAVRSIVGDQAQVMCIPAETEVAWGLLSARATLNLDDSCSRLFVDPGGSSNDLALVAQSESRWKSVPFGMNDLLATVPVDEENSRLEAADLGKLRTFLRSKYQAFHDFIGDSRVEEVVGTSGAALALGAVHACVNVDSRQARIRGAHGIMLELDVIQSIIEEFAPLSAQERRAKAPSLSPTRSRIFVHGALIYEVLLEELKLPEFRLNGFGMKLGGLISVMKDSRDS